MGHQRSKPFSGTSDRLGSTAAVRERPGKRHASGIVYRHAYKIAGRLRQIDHPDGFGRVVLIQDRRFR
jgi:hypothetical protein